MTCGMCSETGIKEKPKFTTMESHVWKLPCTHQRDASSATTA